LRATHPGRTERPPGDVCSEVLVQTFLVEVLVAVAAAVVTSLLERLARSALGGHAS
jgi:hypothetical protein